MTTYKFILIWSGVIVVIGITIRVLENATAQLLCKRGNRDEGGQWHKK